MTEKSFDYNVNKNSIEFRGKHFAFCNGQQLKISKKMNELYEENERLKLSNRLLLEEMKEIRDKLTVYLEIRKGD